MSRNHKNNKNISKDLFTEESNKFPGNMNLIIIFITTTNNYNKK